MSYSRWSTTIGFDFDLAFPGLDIFDQLNAFYSVTAERRLCLLQSQRAFFSDWYVYWDAPQSKAELGHKGQVLAIYGPCSWDRSPFYSYDVLKFVATRERWRAIDGYAECGDHRDCFHLAKCVREWLADVEDRFPE